MMHLNKNTRRTILNVLPVFIGMFCPVLASAQNMQVIGSNSFSQACYRASTAAALSSNASPQDIENCDKAISYDKLKRRDLIATYVNRGVINVALEDYVAAAKDYNRAIDLDPNVAEAYLNRGNLWFMSNRYGDAIADYDRALELKVGQPYIALLNRGMVRETVGQLAKAKADFEAALAQREGWSVAEQKLARVTKKMAQAARAQDDQEQE